MRSSAPLALLLALALAAGGAQAGGQLEACLQAGANKIAAEKETSVRFVDPWCVCKGARRGALLAWGRQTGTRGLQISAGVQQLPCGPGGLQTAHTVPLLSSYIC